MTQRTDIHLPGAEAPTVSGQTAHCSVCKIQWQVKGDSDKLGCSFCNAGKDAITIKFEKDR